MSALQTGATQSEEVAEVQSDDADCLAWAGLGVALLVLVALGMPMSDAVIRFAGNVGTVLWIGFLVTLVWFKVEMKCPVCDT